MNDLYFTGKNKKGLQKNHFHRKCISSVTKWLDIINFVEIAYHPSENEYISLSGEYLIITEF